MSDTKPTYKLVSTQVLMCPDDWPPDDRSTQPVDASISGTNVTTWGYFVLGDRRRVRRDV